MHAIIAHTLTRGFSIATYFCKSSCAYLLLGCRSHRGDYGGGDQDENLGPFLFWMNHGVPVVRTRIWSDKVYVLVSAFRALNEAFSPVRGVFKGSEKASKGAYQRCKGYNV